MRGYRPRFRSRTRKPRRRSDSKMSRLKPEQMALVEKWLCDDFVGYREVVQRMERDFGVRVALSTLSDWYHKISDRRKFEALMRDAKELQATLKAGGEQTFDSLTMLENMLSRLFIQRTHGLDSEPGDPPADSRELIELAQMVMKLRRSH